MKTTKTSWLGFLVCLVLLASPQVGVCTEDRIVHVSGALPLSDLVTGWADDYMKLKPGKRVAVFGKSAGYGYHQFLDGQANLVMATRRMTKEEQKLASEKGMRTNETLVMNIPVAIVTNAENPVDSITYGQLKDIYTGKVSNWKDVGGPNEQIKVLMRPYPETGVTVLFKDLVLKDLDFRPDAVTMSSYRSMVTVCEKAMAIGHMPGTGAYCNPAKYRIKILGLKQDATSQAAFPGKDEYGLNMPFFFVWNAATVSPEVEDFVKYSLNRAKEVIQPQ